MVILSQIQDQLLMILQKKEDVRKLDLKVHLRNLEHLRNDKPEHHWTQAIAVIGEKPDIVKSLFPLTKQRMELYDNMCVFTHYFIVKLVTVAVRFGVVDTRAVVHVLVAGGDIQPVECTLAAFIIECHIDLVSHKLPAQRKVMRRKSAGSLLPNLGRGHVVTVGTFLLQFAMIDDRVLGDGYFGHRVGQVDAIVQTNVAFDNCDLGVALVEIGAGVTNVSRTSTRG